MKQERKFLFILLLCMYWTISGHAQEAIPMTGGNASGSGGSVSYTGGQIASGTFSGSNGSVVQGVQQPYEISVITGIEEAEGITLFCSVYPNPITDFITLKVENYDNKDLHYQLFDINGNLLENKKIDGNEITIPMSNRSPSVYILKVTDKNKMVKTFKIIKN
jgi:hypothetical protein